MYFFLSRAFTRSVLIVMCVFGLIAMLASARAQVVDGVADTADPERFVPKPVSFSPCVEDQRLECGMLTVPVAYGDPNGATIQIAVIRAKATKPAERIGVMVGNPGGPGFSGVDFILGGVNAPIFKTVNERFDIVGFDPRGVSRSEPVHCFVDPAGDPTEIDPGERAQFFDDFGTRIANACLDQNGSVILSMSTNNAARDLDTLRRALGEEQISYVGLSAGTYLGAVYASLFPQHVRAMLLDAAFPPEFHDNLVEFLSEQAAAFELVFQHVDQLCAADATCPLHDAGVVRTFDQLRARLAADPVTSPRGQVLTDVELRNVVADSLYGESGWPTMVQALARARSGDFRYFFANADSALINIRLALDTTVFDSYDVMFCNDNGTRRPAADHLAVDQTRGMLFPRFFGPFYISGETARCGSWPSVDTPIIRNARGRIANPILFVGNDFDPATPLSWTRSLAHVLGAERNLVRYTGGGHGLVTRGNACMDAITAAYLFELTIPPEGTTCTGLFEAGTERWNVAEEPARESL